MGSSLGIALLFIGFILIVNAAWLQGKVETKDAGWFNLFVGALSTLVVIYVTIKGNPNLGGAVMLFALTYIWVGTNALRGAEDQRGLGGYCLLVAITAFANGAWQLIVVQDFGWTFEWLTYAILWWMFYEVLAAGRAKLMPATIVMTYFVGFEVAITGWIYLYDLWPFANGWPFLTGPGV